MAKKAQSDSTSKPESTYDFGYLKGIDSCPPANAIGIDGVFYAFHDSDPPGEEDFQTAAQRSKFAGKDECQRRSNSIWSDLGALQKRLGELRERHPLRFRFVSAGEIKKCDGVVQNAFQAHCSFWVCRKTSMHSIFNKKVQ